MDIETFLYGLMAFVFVGGICMLVMTDLYSPDNYNIDLTQDKDTAQLTVLQAQINQSRLNIISSNDQMQKQVLSNATFPSEITSSSLIGSAWKSLTSIPQYIVIFLNLIAGMIGSVGSGATQYFLWFFVGMIVIGLSITIINAILGKVGL